MNRYDAASVVRGWADEAENGNYHEFADALRTQAEFIEHNESIKGRLPLIRCYDEFDEKNIYVMEIE